MFNFMGSYVFLIISFLIDFFIIQPRSRREIDLHLINNLWDNSSSNESDRALFARSSTDILLSDFLESSSSNTNLVSLNN
ncbi:hypothetical protein BB561_003938 [Smittium simulii]|uniref:YTH domain-containing protein n=1 Tax=Smittium simulii TaxID=133385 RepID=A0A2T9YIX4_9FUNG|nr:hypothetical protein BB561_003938 [Smittium simulii]